MTGYVAGYGWTDELMAAVAQLRGMGYRVNRLENGDFALGRGRTSARLLSTEIVSLAGEMQNTRKEGIAG